MVSDDSDGSDERTPLTIEPAARSCPACGTTSRTLYYGDLTSDMASRQLFGEPSDHEFVCDSDCPVEVFRGHSTERDDVGPSDAEVDDTSDLTGTEVVCISGHIHDVSDLDTVGEQQFCPECFGAVEGSQVLAARRGRNEIDERYLESETTEETMNDTTDDTTTRPQDDTVRIEVPRDIAEHAYMYLGTRLRGDKDDELRRHSRAFLDELRQALAMASGDRESSTERYAVVDVVAPDGSVEDTVRVQFDYEQPLGIDPLDWHGDGYNPSSYTLELVYLVIDGTQYLADETRSVGAGAQEGSQ